MSKKNPATLWAFDTETDPFKYGRIPKVFLVCAVSEHGDKILFWGDDAAEKFMDWILNELQNALLIAHNGGKFDTLFFKEILHGNMLMADGRILKCSPKKNVEIRDSMSILPMPLKKLGAKFEIDIRKLEREVREKHKAEIIRYCMQDCEVLLGAVQNFYARAGSRRLTIAGQASAELRAIYPDLPKLGENHHKEFSQFFYGGRVQCFEKGIIEFGKKGKLVDRNSMYPAEMAFSYHPYGSAYKAKPFSLKNIPENLCGFFSGVCDANGCFPIRNEKTKETPYTVGRNLPTKITIHELKAAIDCGLAKNFRGYLYIPEFSTRFDKFILGHYESRKKAKAIGDEGGDIYHKLIPNSSYGRFAMSPDGREETYYAEQGEDIKEMLASGWKVKDIDLESERYILARDVTRPWLFYEDVATGASITGASRANLMRNLHASVRPLYCDTDSIMCEEFNGQEGKELGEWKREADFDVAAIAGKKMYVLLDNKRVVKQASKGVRACPTQIYCAADGEEETVVQDAPVMRLSGTKFMTRKIRRT